MNVDYIVVFITVLKKDVINYVSVIYLQVILL